MKTEREMFDEWYKSEYPLDYEHYVNEQDIGLFTKLYWRCFVSWKASAQRDDYKLVPVEINGEIESAMFSSVVRGEMPCDIYKAMTGAVE